MKISLGKKIIVPVAIGSILLVFTATGYTLKEMERQKVEGDYSYKITLIKNNAVEAQNKQLEIINCQNKPVQEQVKDLHDVCKNKTMFKDLERLNNEQKYVTVKKMKAAENRTIREVVDDLETTEQVLNKVDIILEECIKWDESFKELRERKDCSYNKTLEESETLKKENDRIQAELAELIENSNEIGPILARIKKALQFRENSIRCYYQALFTDFQSSVAAEVCNSYMEQASGFINTAYLSCGETEGYAAEARKATDNAKEQEKILDDNLVSSQRYYSDADEMMEKYRAELGV